MPIIDLTDREDALESEALRGAAAAEREDAEAGVPA